MEEEQRGTRARLGEQQQPQPERLGGRQLATARLMKKERKAAEAALMESARAQELQEVTMEARLVAAQMLASMTLCGEEVGSAQERRAQEAAEEAAFKELCEAADISPEQLQSSYRRQRASEQTETMRFTRRCRAAGVTVGINHKRAGTVERVRRAKEWGEATMEARMGKDWRTVSELNLEYSRQKAAFEQRAAAVSEATS